MPRYIDADALIKRLYGMPVYSLTVLDVMHLVDDSPTEDVVERKTGKWINNNGLYQCSCCKHIWSELWWVVSCPMERMYKIMCFCPNCGAEMRERSEEWKN